MHLTYTGGGKYANAAKTYREGGKVMKTYVHLGKVVDREKGIFDHKELGLVRFDLEKEEFLKVDETDVPHPLTEEKLILDFGDAYFLDRYVREKGFVECIGGLDVPELDTLRSLIVYYIVSDKAIGHASDWYTGSYSSILYPKANLDDRYILEYYEVLGDESNYSTFFSKYIPLVTKGSDRANVIIDSTGLPNDVHIPISTLSNHNDHINNEIRLITVVNKDSGMPVFVRYIPGNTVDSMTLVKTMRELERKGVKCDYALIDTEYLADTDIRDLFGSKTGFMSRLDHESALYKNLQKEVFPGIMVRDNFTMFGERRLYIKRVGCDLAKDCPGYAYCVLDMDRKNMEDARLAKRAVRNGLTDGEVFDSISDTGFFVVISDTKFENSEVLPNYCIKQNVEQFTYIDENNTSPILPPVHSEEAFRGHLLVSFIAAAVVQSLRNDLVKIGKPKKQEPEMGFINKSPNLVSALIDLRGQKCKVYDEVILPKEAQTKANALYSMFKLEVPYAIPKMK